MLIWHIIQGVCKSSETSLQQCLWNRYAKIWPRYEFIPKTDTLEFGFPYVLLSGIWHYLYNLKYVDDIHGWVLLLIKLQASVWNLLKVTLFYWCFLRFLHCTMVPNRAKHYKTISDQSSNFVPPQNTSKWKVSGRKPLKPNGYLNQDFGTMSFACMNIVCPCHFFPFTTTYQGESWEKPLQK